jgi:ABC-type glycerol-3-phosphate transport system permease component
LESAKLGRFRSLSKIRKDSASEYNLDYGPTLAGYVIGSMLLLLLFAVGMRPFIQGIAADALKT